MVDQCQNSVRAFIALEISPEVRSRLATVRSNLEAPDVKITWVAPEKIHLTLAFLGDIPLAHVETLCRGLDDIGAKIPRFACDITGVGFFGSPKRPRTIWVGVKGEPSLFELHQCIRPLLMRLKIRVADRTFDPHLTLGRIRSAKRTDSLIHQIEEMKDKDFGSVAISSVELIKSVLTPSGPEYTELHRATLQQCE